MSSLSWQSTAGPARPHSNGSRRPIFERRSSTSRGSTSASSTSSFSDDEDAITPCPPQSFSPQEQHQKDREQDHTPRQQPRPKSLRPNAQRPESWRSSQVMQAHDDEPHPESPTVEAEVDSVTLWRRMLVIQRMFGCYNSARMRAALDSGAEDGFVPSRTCLDLLNDSIDQLPEESRRQLEQFLGHSESGSSSRRKSWRQRLQEMRMLH